MGIRRWVQISAIMTVVLSYSTGCRDSEPAKSSVDRGAEVKAKLVRADEYDGTADRIVSKCSACALGMDGNSKYALEVEGYTLHFCSQHCKDAYAKDPTMAILALKIPEQ